MRALFSTVVLLSLGMGAQVPAQTLPTEPVSVAGGRMVFGGEFFATVGSDDPGFFNYNDYEYSAFRNVRLAVSTEVRAARRLQFLAEVRLDHGDRLSAYALFARVRPWPDRQFDLQVGRVPPTFGAFTRTIYAYDNLVIGQPLAYQYLLSIKPTAVPSAPSDLARMRGRGWLSDFPIGDAAPSPGLPIVNTARYDTGVMAHGVAGAVEWTGAITQGTLSDPRLGDNNGRPQLAGRVVVQAAPGLRLGASAARGAWLDERLDSSLAPGPQARDHAQSAVALDAEVSRGHWLARAEWLRSAWAMPSLAAPQVNGSLAAQALIVEGRYRLWPGLSLAARVDGLWFSDAAAETAPDAGPWEANVHRIETAVAWSLVRNVTAKLAWQRNRRAGGRERHDSLWAAQLVYWF